MYNDVTYQLNVYSRIDSYQTNLLTEFYEFFQTRLSGYSALDALLNEITPHENYTVDMFRRQLAYYAAQHWNELSHLILPLILTGECYESYLRNMFQGLNFSGPIEILICGHMWNMKISIISAYLPTCHILHSDDEPDALLIHNGRDGLDSHFSGCVGLEADWSRQIPITPDTRVIGNVEGEKKKSREYFSHVMGNTLQLKHVEVIEKIDRLLGNVVELLKEESAIRVELTSLGVQCVNLKPFKLEISSMQRAQSVESDEELEKLPKQSVSKRQKPKVLSEGEESDEDFQKSRGKGPGVSKGKKRRLSEESDENGEKKKTKSKSKSEKTRVPAATPEKPRTMTIGDVTFYYCIHCDKRFKKKHACEEHSKYVCESNVDKLPPPFSCKLFTTNEDDEQVPCTFTTVRKQNYIEHCNIHKGIKTYFCKYIGCDEAFFNSSMKSKHEVVCKCKASGLKQKK